MMEDISGSARHWQELADHLGKVGQRIHQLASQSHTAQQHAEVDQNLLWSLAIGALSYSQMDPDHPDWLPWANNAIRYTDASPDAVYYISRIRGSGVYRITGMRGTVRLIDLQVNKGYVGYSEYGPTLQNIDFNDIAIAKDGSFEIILSPSRPAGYGGNWIQLDAAVDDVFLLVRQISYDWLNEEDAKFTIQRIDKPIDQPRHSAEDIGFRISQIPGYIDKLARAMIRIIEIRQPGEREANQFQNVSAKMDNQPASVKQDYYVGRVILSPDEALIVENHIPEDCPYWSVQLMDSFYNCLDHMYHQSGLNGHTARMDPDGKVRIVVSQKDPGVANWLDKGDYEMTRIIWRWYRCSGAPITRKVPLSDVRRFMYPGTPLVSIEERQEMLRKRAIGAQLRRRW